MTRSYFKWIVAAACAAALLTALFLYKDNKKQPQPIKEYAPRPASPYTSYISAVGVVEAHGGNIYIGSPVDRVINKIYVDVGQKVKKGDMLFELNSLDLQADWASKCYDYENAQANLKKLEALPRMEDLIAADAELRNAEIELSEAKHQFERVRGLDLGGAMSQEEVSRRQFAVEKAEGRLLQAKASKEKIQAGAWLPDLEIAKFQVLQAKALMERVEAEIERTMIRAPSDATILQVKIHEGEFPPSDPSRSPSMIIGDTDTLCLRVAINQYDAAFFDSKKPAAAYLQGNSSIEFPLAFQHLEPFFVTKQNLNNDITEKIDTRVLQAIYCFNEGENRIFVGQQMNVFIETDFIAENK